MKITVPALLSLVVLCASSCSPAYADTTAPGAACLKPADAVAFIQSRIGTGAKAEEDMHLTTPDAVQAFAKAMMDVGAPESVLSADEVVVVRAKLPNGEYSGQEAVQFFVKGYKTNGGLVPSAAIAVLKGDPA